MNTAARAKATDDAKNELVCGHRPNPRRNYPAIVAGIAGFITLLLGAIFFPKMMGRDSWATFFSSYDTVTNLPFSLVSDANENKRKVIVVPTFAYTPRAGATPIDELFQREVDIYIPAGPLSVGLRLLGSATPFFRDDDLRGVRTPGVNGRLKIGEAVDALLQGTGCQKEVVRNETYQVYCRSAANLIPRSELNSSSSSKNL